MCEFTTLRTKHSTNWEKKSAISAFFLLDLLEKWQLYYWELSLHLQQISPSLTQVKLGIFFCYKQSNWAQFYQKDKICLMNHFELSAADYCRAAFRKSLKTNLTIKQKYKSSLILHIQIKTILVDSIFFSLLWLLSDTSNCGHLLI